MRQSASILRERLVLEEISESTAAGHVATSWRTASAALPAAVALEQGPHRDHSGRERPGQRARVTIRRRDLSPERIRLTYRGRKLMAHSASPLDAQRRWLEIICTAEERYPHTITIKRPGDGAAFDYAEGEYTPASDVVVYEGLADLLPDVVLLRTDRQSDESADEGAPVLLPPTSADLFALIELGDQVVTDAGTGIVTGMRPLENTILINL